MFKYVLEELLASKSWQERFADRVVLFISKPHFIILHLLWFVVWILVNEGYLSVVIEHFDEFSYGILGIILAIEAVLIAGFLLISQHHQYNYSEKRAELDYEINIRSYRKLLAMAKRLANLTLNTVDRQNENL